MLTHVKSQCAAGSAAFTFCVGRLMHNHFKIHRRLQSGCIIFFTLLFILKDASQVEEAPLYNVAMFSSVERLRVQILSKSSFFTLH